MHLFEMIRQMARDGFGYEDIGVRLGVPWRHVRPFVIRVEYDNLQRMRVESSEAERKAPEL